MLYTRLKLTALSLLALMIIYALSYCYIDKQLALWAHQHIPGTPWYGWSARLGSWFKSSHWTVAAILMLFIGAGAYASNRQHSGKHWLLIAGSILVTQTIAWLLKFSLARYRPECLFNNQLYGFHFWSNIHSMNSTPSGHTCSAFAGLYALSRWWKRSWLTNLLLAIAALIGISRLLITAHYMSDVIFGAYIGILTVIWLHAIFDR